MSTIAALYFGAHQFVSCTNLACSVGVAVLAWKSSNCSSKSISHENYRVKKKRPETTRTDSIRSHTIKWKVPYQSISYSSSISFVAFPQTI